LLPASATSPIPIPCAPTPRADRLERRQVAEQLVDLERARDAAARALEGLQRGDVLAVEQDAPAVGTQHARQEIHERRLAGAVGTDQRVARAVLDRSVTSLVATMPPKLAADADGLQRGAHRAREPLAERRTGATHRAMRSRPISTMTTSIEAEPELPVLRRDVGEPVLHELEHDGADQPAVEIADAADDEDEKEIGRASNEKTSSDVKAVVCVRSAPATPA
jgi:hypothetical protein